MTQGHMFRRLPGIGLRHYEPPSLPRLLLEICFASPILVPDLPLWALGVLEDDILFQSTIPEAADMSMAIVYAIFGVCSVLGNSMLLYVSYKKKHLLKPAEFFIVNLAVSDLGLTISLYPWAIMSSIFHRWLFGKTACLIYAFCGLLFGICSLTTLTLLSMVCFMKVCYPLYGNRFRPVHGRLLVACAWLYALAFAGCPLAHWGEYGPEPYGTACCIDLRLSNLQLAARSYTLVLFVSCYLVPCAIIVASYVSILVTVCTTKRAMERHVPMVTRMSNIQAIIVKLSVAVCIGFFAAWSPYAVVSMWAAFGHLDNIPPLAFAVPAMFAKSSTIYNPLVYMLLRPTFRKVMWRDLGLLRRTCLQGCCCCCARPLCPTAITAGPSGPSKPPVPEVAIVPLRRTRRQDTLTRLAAHAEVALQGGAAREAEVRPVMVGRAGSLCGDAYECFRHYPRACCSHPHHAEAPCGPCLAQDKVTAVPSDLATERKTPRLPCLRGALRERTQQDVANLEFDVETVPGHVKVAWP
ncbi:opsin-5-like [Engraulis encrasicolus]|uniref:opsin-5-like n=1 Tax=Engraulis encrasicolus TaxID=184585 RepID=UPI002FD5274A